MSCKEIDMAAYKRRAHFDYFRSLAYPYAGVTVEVDISRLVPTLKMHSLPFFLPVLYCAVRAANSVPEFRQRIHGDSVVEYDYCEGSYTVALPDESYCYCVPKTDLPFGEFLDYTREAQRRAVEEPSIEEQDEADSLLFISCIPWVSQTAVVQPVPSPADSNPRITWGKYFERCGNVYLPVSVLCHRDTSRRNHQRRSSGNVKRIGTVSAGSHDFQYIHVIQKTDTMISHFLR